EPPPASFGPEQIASVVIYFQLGTSDRDAEGFRESVLCDSGQSRGSLPSFVREYLRLAPSQANGHYAIALTFDKNVPPERAGPYLEKIESDHRVATVYLDTAPASI